MEDIKYKRRKLESPEKSSRNDHDEQKSKSNSTHGKDGGEEKYETKVSSSSGKLLNPCIYSRMDRLLSSKYSFRNFWVYQKISSGKFTVAWKEDSL